MREEYFIAMEVVTMLFIGLCFIIGFYNVFSHVFVNILLKHFFSWLKIYKMLLYFVLYHREIVPMVKKKIKEAEELKKSTK